MKHTWKNRMSALFLSAVMVLGMAPTAMAADWQHDPKYHWHTDSDRAEHTFTETSYTPPTCYTAGTSVERCTVCGYEKSTSYEATGNHVYSTVWSKDSTYHWHACTTSGCTASTDRAQHTPIGNGTVTAPTCTNEGYVTYTCSECGQTYTQTTAPALGHDFVNGVCTRCGKADTSSSITVTFINGGSTFQTQSNVRSGAYPVNPGTPSFSKSGWTYAFKGWTTVNPGANAVYNGQALVSVTNTPVTASVTYYAVYTVSGSGQNVSASVSASGNTTVGSTLRSGIDSLFSGMSGHSFSTLTFSSTSSSSYGTLYANSNKKSLTGNTYTYSGGSYPVSDLYFQPGSRSGNYTASYTARDDAGNTMSGTVTISTGNSSSSGDITYKVKTGDSVSFKRADFNEFFQKEYADYDVRWVEFETDDTLSSSKGMLYSNYKESKEKSFTQSTIDDYQFYYSSSSYGDYALNDLSFVAGDTDRTVTLTFRAYYSSSRYVKGTVKIIIGDSSTSDGDITYKVDTNDSVYFKRADFNDFFQKEYKDYDVRWVEFETDDTLSSSKGMLYANYKGSKEKSFSDSTIDDYQFYYSSDSYGDYALNALSFVAGDTDRTVTLTFRAYYSSSRYVKGTVKIIIGDSSTSDGTITYKVDTNDSISFKRADFNDAFQKEYKDYDIRWVEFDTDDTLSASAGTVYYNYKGSDEKSFSRSSIDDYKFYYSSKSYGDYALNDLTFVSGDESRTVTLNFRAYYSDSRYIKGTVKIIIGKDSSTDGDIAYKVAAGEKVDFDRADFNKFFQKEYKDYSIRWVEFDTDDTLSDSSSGVVYYNYKEKDEKSFSRTTIDDYKFYYSSSSYGDYGLSGLSFVAGSKFTKAVTLNFRAYYSDSRYVKGTVVIQPTKTTASSVTITYKAAPSEKVDFNRADFNNAFQKEYSAYTVKYVTFDTDDALSTSSTGSVCFDYKGSDERAFTKNNLSDYKFYYSSAAQGDYALNQLSFVAGGNFSKAVTLKFTAYYSDTRYVSGKVVINPADTVPQTSGVKGDIRYYATGTGSVQINQNDIARFFKKSYPSATLQSVTLNGVPSSGSLYYNYYGVSKYGASKLLLNAGNCGTNPLYFSPSSTAQYALSELSYIPSGTGYCAQIPFTANGGGKSVSGTILISVSKSAVSEVYGATPKGGAVAFPATAIYTAVATATGQTLGGIQLLELPSSSVGTVYAGSGTSTRATTTDVYSYSGSGTQMGQLRFVPASGYTGSVEIPYAAYDGNGTAIAAGKFSLGVVNSVKKFSDVDSSTWCYKYVAELSDKSIINGYSDGSFKPNSTVTYGAALKLIMLAAGYPEQKPSTSNPFSGYLDKARSEGIITRSNVDLTKPITRLQVAQIAAGALKLDKTNLSSVQPFTDTTDASVRALNAAGVVEGYFSGGTSTYRPNNTLTRGQISAIVWRMKQL